MGQHVSRDEYKQQKVAQEHYAYIDKEKVVVPSRYPACLLNDLAAICV